MRVLLQMNNKCIKSIIVSLLLLGNVAGYAANDHVPVEPEILDVAQMYFAALSSGDKDQLRDPAYSQLLVDRYGTARLEIVDSGVQGELYSVDIIIWMNDIESIKERLVIRAIDSPDGPSYRIVSRETFGY